MKKREIERKSTKGEKTKQKLFFSAAKLFNQYDFNEVTVDRIVEDARVAKGTFYIYFKSKDALIASFLYDYVKKVDMDYRAVLDSFLPNTSASQMLLELVGKIADMLTNTIGCMSMSTVYKLMLSNTIDISSVKGYDRELYQLFADVLKRGVEQREFKLCLSLNEQARHLVMAIRGLSYEWCIRYPDFDLKTQALSHFQILLNGIKI